MSHIISYTASYNRILGNNDIPKFNYQRTIVIIVGCWLQYSYWVIISAHILLHTKSQVQCKIMHVCILCAMCLWNKHHSFQYIYLVLGGLWLFTSLLLILLLVMTSLLPIPLSHNYSKIYNGYCRHVIVVYMSQVLDHHLHLVLWQIV